jgi:hypothetical protein
VVRILDLAVPALGTLTIVVGWHWASRPRFGARAAEKRAARFALGEQISIPLKLEYGGPDATVGSWWVTASWRLRGRIYLDVPGDDGFAVSAADWQAAKWGEFDDYLAEIISSPASGDTVTFDWHGPNNRVTAAMEALDALTVKDALGAADL